MCVCLPNVQSASLRFNALDFTADVNDMTLTAYRFSFFQINVPIFFWGFQRWLLGSQRNHLSKQMMQFVDKRRISHTRIIQK